VCVQFVGERDIFVRVCVGKGGWAGGARETEREKARESARGGGGGRYSDDENR